MDFQKKYFFLKNILYANFEKKLVFIFNNAYICQIILHYCLRNEIYIAPIVGDIYIIIFLSMHCCPRYKILCKR